MYSILHVIGNVILDKSSEIEYMEFRLCINHLNCGKQQLAWCTELKMEYQLYDGNIWVI